MDTKEWEAQQAAGGLDAMDRTPGVSAKRYRDFDAFFEERTQEPIIIKLYGENHAIPADMPALLMLRVMRAAEEAKAKGLDSMLEVMSDKDVLDMAAAIFGRERLDAWSEKGLGIEQVGRMVEWCGEQYQQIIEAKQGNRKAAPEKPGKRRR